MPRLAAQRTAVQTEPVTSEPDAAPTVELDPAEPSAVVSALSGLGGLVLGSTIVYFALPYCLNC